MRTRFLGAVAVAASCVGLSGTTQIAAQGQTAQPERACPMIREFPAFHECAVEKMTSFETSAAMMATSRSRIHGTVEMW